MNEVLQNTSQAEFQTFLPKDSAGRIIWSSFNGNQQQFNEAIENEVKQMLNSEGANSIPSRTKTSDVWKPLYRGISSRYPGGIEALKAKLNLATTKPSGYWQNLSNIEVELQRVIDQLQGFPTQQDLKKLNFTSLSAAISQAGGFRYWRNRLEQVEVKKPDGYWNNADTVEREVREFIQANKLEDFPSRTQLTKLGGSKIQIGISRTGGHHMWRKKLGYSAKQSPKNFWSPEEIEREVRDYITNHGDLTSSSVTKDGTNIPQIASKHYPGGLTALKNKLGIELEVKPNGYWSPEKIEEEANKFFVTYGGLTQSLMIAYGRADLLASISTKYPEMLTGLKTKLGIDTDKNPIGFWTPEKIEEEAFKIYQATGNISFGHLRQIGRQDLAGAINKKYPGAFIGLKKKLSISPKDHRNIDSAIANEQLRGLLEGGQS